MTVVQTLDMLSLAYLLTDKDQSTKQLLYDHMK